MKHSKVCARSDSDCCGDAANTDSNTYKLSAVESDKVCCGSAKAAENGQNRAKCGFLHSNRLVVGRKSGAQELANADLRTVRGNG